MPKYLVEIILVVNVEEIEEARKIANYIAEIPIPEGKIEDKIEALRVEEIVQITDQRPR